MVLLGREFWGGLLEWSQERQLGGGLLSAEDLNCLQVVDTVEETLATLLPARERFCAEQAAPGVACGRGGKTAPRKARRRRSPRPRLRAEAPPHAA